MVAWHRVLFLQFALFLISILLHFGKEIGAEIKEHNVAESSGAGVWRGVGNPNCIVSVLQGACD